MGALPAELRDHVERHARLVRRARPGRDEEPVGPVSAMPSTASASFLTTSTSRAELAQVLDEVPRERVVVVEDEDAHRGPSSARGRVGRRRRGRGRAAGAASSAHFWSSICASPRELALKSSLPSALAYGAIASRRARSTATSESRRAFAQSLEGRPPSPRRAPRPRPSSRPSRGPRGLRVVAGALGVVGRLQGRVERLVGVDDLREHRLVARVSRRGDVALRRLAARDGEHEKRDDEREARDDGATQATRFASRTISSIASRSFAPSPTKRSAWTSPRSRTRCVQSQSRSSCWSCVRHGMPSSIA